MNKLKRFLALALCLSLLVGLAACGNKGGGEKKDGLTPLTFALDYTPNTNHTGIYVALDKGYYKEAGLDVTVAPPPDGGATGLVAAGKADFGIDFQDLLAPGFAQSTPIPVTAVAAMIQHNTSGILSLQDKQIKSPKDLAGKTYATWNNPVELAMVRDVIAKDGGDPAALKTVPNSATDVLAGLQTNLEAVWVYYAWDGIAAKEKGLNTNYFAFRDINPVFDYYTPVIIANNEFLKKNPDRAKAFLAATAKGYQYAIEHPDEAADVLLKHADGLDPAIVKASQKWLADQYIGDAERWGVIDGKRWNAFYQWLDANKLVERKIPDDFGFSNDYLPSK